MRHIIKNWNMVLEDRQEFGHFLSWYNDLFIDDQIKLWETFRWHAEGRLKQEPNNILLQQQIGDAYIHLNNWKKILNGKIKFSK